MTTSARQQVLDDVNTTLANLLSGLLPGGAAAKVRITTLERCLKTWSQVGALEFPWLGFGGVEEDYAHEPGGQINVELRFKIVAHVSSSPTTFDQVTADISNIADDVIAALNTDTTRSGNAIDTTIIHTASSEGESAPADSRGFIGSIEMDWKIRYQRTVRST